MKTQFQNINTIIWDWNGTLLNDTDICIESINELLLQRGLSTLSKEKYLKLFGFPVIEYYKKIGFDFDKEPFNIPAHQYIEIYSSKINKSSLHNQVPEVLEHYKRKGLKQIVLSASEHIKLLESIDHFNILDFFDEVSGLNDHFAVSKTTLGMTMLKKKGIAPVNACFVGDTDHDYEVANTLGCKCILIANGHQLKSRLVRTGAVVLDKISEIFKCF